MEEYRPQSIPLMRIAPMFYKEKTFWETRLTPEEQSRDIGSIDHIDYNPHDLDELLVTSLARISIYDSNSLEVKRTFKTNTQFQVYGGCFRKNDGRLVAAASEEGKVFVFESHNTNPLRTFDLKAPTHRVLFMENKLVAFSDDMAFRILDVGSGITLKTYGGKADSSEHFHQDYVRCGCLIDRLIVSGSYDNMIKLWDPRLDSLKPVMEFDHGHSVESFCTRGDTLLMSVGGTKLQVFDMVASKTLTNIIPKHHKTITCVANYEDKYLLTGALDGYLNVLDFNYEYLTRFSYDEAQILSLAVNPKLLAVGFNNHNIHIRRFKDFIKKSNNEMAELEKLQSGYFGPNMVTRYFHEAIAESQDPAATHRAMLAIRQKKTPTTMNDVESLYEPVIIPRVKYNSMSKRPTFERFFRGFEHSKALRFSLDRHEKYPDDVIYVLQELVKRDKLKVAMTSCGKLITLMKFISTHLSDIRHNRILLDSGLTLISLMLVDKSLIQDDLEYWIEVEHLSRSLSDELLVIDSCSEIGAQLGTIISQY